MAKSPATAPETETSGETEFVSPACMITAKVPGFRRAGIAHPSEPQIYEPGRFTEAEMTALIREPNLVVVPAPSVLTAPAAPAAPTDTSGAGA